jgi:hypothetical protein
MTPSACVEHYHEKSAVAGEVIADDRPIDVARDPGLDARRKVEAIQRSVLGRAVV